MAMASLQAGYKQTYSNIKIWNIATSAWVNLSYSANNNQQPVGSQIDCFGSEFAVLTRLQQHWGETVYGLTYSVGGTELGTALNASANWNASTVNSYCDTVCELIFKATANMWNSLGIRNIDFYFIWGQGEQDSKSLTDTNAYTANQTALFTRIKSCFSGTAFNNSKKIFICPRTKTTITSAHNTSTTITGATNATPIVLTIEGAHGLATGRQVIISDVEGNTAANGTWTITNTGATTFSLQGSVGNGIYTSGGFVNHFIYPSQIATAQANVSFPNYYSYSTDSYSVQSDNTHFDAQGYEDKGVALVNIITSNNL